MENSLLTSVSEDLHRHTKDLRVLYVEHSQPIRHATQAVLQEYFNHLDIAEDGIQAFDLYKKFYNDHNQMYDIVITCLRMPKMEGGELCRALFEFNPDQKIIIISSCSEISSLIELLNLGIKKFVTKPIERQQLHDVISDIAHRIYADNLKKEEYAEIASHNALLKRREEIYLKKLESSLKTYEEFNDALNESGIVSKTDPNGNITYVNDQFCLLSGYSRLELIGKNHRIVNCGEMSASYFEKLWHDITSQKSHKMVFKNRSKEGHVYFVESLIKPIVNLDGEITEFISVGHDITRMMNSIENAKHAQETKDDFFRNISHEMRTPLNAIIGLTSLLKEFIDGNQETMHMIDVIEQNNQNLHQLVESVLDIQNIQQNSLQLHPKEFELLPFLKASAMFIENKAHQKGIIVNRTIDCNLPIMLIADYNRLEQVIRAVLDNAVKFTPSGGKVDFNTTYDHAKKLLIFKVHDTGIGIEEKDQKKIFQFTQLDGSTTRNYEGAGLSLTLVHAIVQEMNGTISLSSSPNEGTTFIITLPLEQPGSH